MCVCLGIAFCVFFWFSLNYFVLALFAFVVLGSFFQHCAKRLVRKNVPKMTYFLSSGT